MRREVIASLLGLMLGVAGQAADIPARAVESPVLRAVSARAVYARCRNKGTLHIDDPRGKLHLGVNVEVHAAATGHLKIRATRAAFKAFTILMTPAAVQFYLPRERKLYTGTPLQFARGLGLFSPEEMMRLILQGHPEFRNVAWTPDGIGPENERLFVMARQPGEDYLRVALPPSEDRLARVEYLYGDTGETARSIEYSRYMTVRVNGEEKVFPRIIRIRWPFLERRVVLRIRGVDDDPVIDNTTWDVEASDKTVTLPLAELALQSDGTSADEQ